MVELNMSFDEACVRVLKIRGCLEKVGSFIREQGLEPPVEYQMLFEELEDFVERVPRPD